MGLSIGLLPPDAAAWDGPATRRLVERCDATGLDHLAAGDHISFFVGAGCDGLLFASRYLTLSDRLAANTAVYLLPLRHPVVVARQLADLALARGEEEAESGIHLQQPLQQSCRAWARLTLAG